MKLSEQLIYCTTKITSVIEENHCITGTGFFMNFNEDKSENKCQPVIITNKHIVKNANKIIFSVCKADSKNNPIDQEKFTITLEKFKIIDHPSDDVDLCAIPIAPVIAMTAKDNVRLFSAKLGTDLIIKDEEINDCSAIEEIIMIGYPNGIEDTFNNKPIIRKGITSTHIKFDYNGKKEFLIDMACFPGSSGSPIFSYNEFSYMQGKTICFQSQCKLLGLLYAGPQYTTIDSVVVENNTVNPQTVIKIPNNIGVVIKASRIKELEALMKDMK